MGNLEIGVAARRVRQHVNVVSLDVPLDLVHVAPRDAVNDSVDARCLHLLQCVDELCDEGQSRGLHVCVWGGGGGIGGVNCTSPDHVSKRGKLPAEAASTSPHGPTCCFCETQLVLVSSEHGHQLQGRGSYVQSHVCVRARMRACVCVCFHAKHRAACVACWAPGHTAVGCRAHGRAELFECTVELQHRCDTPGQGRQLWPCLFVEDGCKSSVWRWPPHKAPVSEPKACQDAGPRGRGVEHPHGRGQPQQGKPHNHDR
jgi:hypothetical protein